MIIPEPFGSHRVCVGHRGVYWFRVVSEGETAHGAMPFLGRNAISQLAPLLEEIRADLGARTRRAAHRAAGWSRRAPAPPP